MAARNLGVRGTAAAVVSYAINSDAWGAGERRFVSSVSSVGSVGSMQRQVKDGKQYGGEGSQWPEKKKAVRFVPLARLVR